MKKAFKSKKVYIIASILGGLGLIPMIVAIIMATCSSSVFETYPYVMWAIAAIYLMIGYIWGDQHSANYQRKHKTYDEDVPDETKVESWKRRLPFFLATLLLVLVCVTLEIIAACNGAIYPFTETII